MRLWLVLKVTDYGFLIKLHFNTSKLSLYLQNNPYSTNIWLNYAPKHGHQAIGVCIIVTSRTPPLHPLSVSQIQRVSAFIQVFTHIFTQSLGALGYLRAVHQQRVDDAVPPLPAAHSLHAAVVVSQREMCFCAVLHKLPLHVRNQKRKQTKREIV